MSVGFLLCLRRKASKTWSRKRPDVSYQRRWIPLIAAGVFLGLACFPYNSSAQELVYTFINPAFGGNPFNSAFLLGTADRQNDFDPPGSGGRASASETSDVDRFVRNLQSRLLSQLSREVADAIFGENAAESGQIVFGDQTITFERFLDKITLSIVSPEGTTVIEVPLLVVQ